MLNYNLLSGQVQETFDIDPDVLKVLKFIEGNVECAKMCAVVEQVAQLSPLLWGYFDRKEIRPFRMHKS